MTAQETLEYGYSMLAKYGLTNWYIIINDNHKQFGLCFYNENRIEISKYHISLNEDWQIKRTILHEIAHALTKSGHDRQWKDKFSALLNLELNIQDSIKTRFGKGKLPTAAEKKNFNKFELKLPELENKNA